MLKVCITTLLVVCWLNAAPSAATGEIPAPEDALAIPELGQVEDLETAGSGVQVVKAFDLQTAATSFYHPLHDHHGHHDHHDHHGHHGHSNDYHDGYHSSHGYKDGHGYKGIDGKHGHGYGSYGKGQDLGYFDKAGSVYKGNDHNNHYKGSHAAGAFGNKGHLKGSKGHLNKGHKDKGFKNVYHKEEHGFSKVFEDDINKNEFHSLYDDGDAFHKYHKAGGFKGGKFIKQSLSYQFCSSPTSYAPRCNAPRVLCPQVLHFTSVTPSGGLPASHVLLNLLCFQSVFF
ncbi:Protein of unknown function DUF4779 [Trinorchestia longiramus]|nr:Protein of unknown function DUF4779 [Trinorchestia longiramus]